MKRKSNWIGVLYGKKLNKFLSKLSKAEVKRIIK